MKERSGCMRLGTILLVLAGIGAILGVSAVIFYSYSARRRLTLAEQYSPPVVLVTDPSADASAAAGSYLTISATAMGNHPIIRAEVWLDGQLTGTQNAEKPDGSSPFYADFSVLVPSEGPHLAFVRAVDSLGMIGQSAPVSLTGAPKPTDPLLLVTVENGQTLKQIADTYSTSPDVLKGLNPGLGNSPTPGTSIKVPLPPKGGSPAGGGPAGPANPPVPIPDVPMLTLSDKILINPFGGSMMLLSNGPPVAPSGLQAEFKDCKIILRWNDNADNEDKYNVYMTSAEYENYKQALLFASLGPSPKTGPAWYELQTGIIGGVSIWVEAVNSLGASPSNIVWVYVPFVSGSPSSAWEAKTLIITPLDFTVTGPYDMAYCYISFENQPEQWFPIGGGKFIQLSGGKGQGIGGYYSITHPKDEKLDLSGTCLGWAGSTLSDMGPFSASFSPGNLERTKAGRQGKQL